MLRLDIFKRSTVHRERVVRDVHETYDATDPSNEGPLHEVRFVANPMRVRGTPPEKEHEQDHHPAREKYWKAGQSRLVHVDVLMVPYFDRKHVQCLRKSQNGENNGLSVHAHSKFLEHLSSVKPHPPLIGDLPSVRGVGPDPSFWCGQEPTARHLRSLYLLQHVVELRILERHTLRVVCHRLSGNRGSPGHMRGVRLHRSIKEVRHNLALSLHFHFTTKLPGDRRRQKTLCRLSKLQVASGATLHHACRGVDRITEQSVPRQLLPNNPSNHGSSVHAHFELQFVRLQLEYLICGCKYALQECNVPLRFMNLHVVRNDANSGDVLLADGLDLRHTVGLAYLVHLSEILIQETKQLIGLELRRKLLKIRDHDEQNRRTVYLVGYDLPPEHRHDHVFGHHALKDVVQLLTHLSLLQVGDVRRLVPLVQVILLLSGDEEREAQGHKVCENVVQLGLVKVEDPQVVVGDRVCPSEHEGGAEVKHGDPDPRKVHHLHARQQIGQHQQGEHQHLCRGMSLQSTIEPPGLQTKFGRTTLRQFDRLVAREGKGRQMNPD
mmetsp:Transcript_38908/g.103384  ORF Transcript_38908/g.103384 Transcript_38908/m.103384 type:complete len:550 (+) Transcript_38908:1163-2812(+)